MTVKSESAWERLIVMLSMFSILFIGTVFLVDKENEKQALYIILAVFSIVLIWHYVIVGRTLIFDEFGCTIKFYRYQRIYAWQDIEIKRKEQDYWGNLYKHSKGVFFSIYPVNKPKWLDPTVYCMFFHPFTCFYVHPTEPEYFNELLKYKSARAEVGIYLVEEKEFYSKMKEWGVEIEE